MYPEKKAAYRGRLKQYARYLLGRGSLEKKTGVFQAARDCLGQEHPQIITYMKYGRQNDAGIHFGNSSGTNALEGKDIAVIGTPYKNEEAYHRKRAGAVHSKGEIVKTGLYGICVFCVSM